MSNDNKPLNYIYYGIDPETERGFYTDNKNALGILKDVVFTCPSCWSIMLQYSAEPQYVNRCCLCNAKFYRWKWRKRFQERIDLRPSDRQWLMTLTWGKPILNPTREERNAIRVLMKEAFQKLTKTKMWKSNFVGYVAVFEEAIHSKKWQQVDFDGEPYGSRLYPTKIETTIHPHYHIVVEKVDDKRFSKEEFEQLKAHIRKYFAEYVWFKKIRGNAGTAKSINYICKYITKDFGMKQFGNFRKVLIGGTWREKPPTK